MRGRILIGLLLVLLIVGINRPIGLPASGETHTQRADEIYHTGDLVIEGNEIYVIENVTFFIDGSIIVKDNAQLIIRNSRVVWEISHFAEHVGWVRDKGRIVVENSILDRSIPALVFLRVEDNGASLSLYNSTSYWDLHVARGEILFKSSTIGAMIEGNGLFFFGQSNSKATIVDSHVKWIVFKIAGEKPEDVRLVGAHPGKLGKLRVETSEEAILVIENTSVDGWIIDFWSNWSPKKHVILENSEITSIWFWFPPESYVKMKDWRPGYFKYWNLREETILTGVMYDLTLINTTISEYIKLQVSGKAEFDNLERIQVASWNGANVSVNNSILTHGVLLRGKNDFIRIENSTISSGDLLLMNAKHLGSLLGGDGHYLEFHGTTASFSVIEIATNYSKISGDVVFLNSLEDVRGTFGTVEREYPIIVKDERGNPLPSASISLIDSDGRLAWSGIADHKGRALFNITFTKENYSKEWKLTATANGMNLSKEIGFLASTPIILTLRKLASSISLHVSRESVRKGDQIEILGSIDPPLAEIVITLTFERPDGSTFDETIPTDSNGSFSYTFIPEDAGKWSVYASWLGDEKYEGASSSSLSFTVEEVKMPKPAEFTVTDLSISPTEAEVKQTIAISVKVTNVGEQKGSYTIDLKVNGVTLDTKTVTLAGGESTTVTFMIVKEEAGMYDIEVAELKVKFTVKEIQPLLPWELYATVAAVAIVAIGAATIIYRRKRASARYIRGLPSALYWAMAVWAVSVFIALATPFGRKTYV